MSVVNSYTLTVTQADVLYVSHQITADLKKLAACYPRLLDSDEILRLNTAMGILQSSVLLINNSLKLCHNQT